MIRLLMQIDTGLWVLIVGGMWTYIVSLRHRLQGMKNPHLMLPRRERRKWAREQLAQRKENEDLAQLERLKKTL